MIEVETRAASRRTWVVALLVGALLIACYAPVLWSLVRQWSTDDDMGHGFFVPVVAGYLVWQRRERLRAIEPSPCWWGMLLVLCGMAQSYIARMGTELFLSRTAFLVSLTGAVLFLGGRAYLRALAFPLFVLLFMVPIPGIIYGKITFPLQLLASRLAHNALLLMDIPVLREGNVLVLPEQTLSVVEACSGIRSLLSLTFLALIYSYLFETRKWMRVVLFVATIPIAIIANAGRVTLTGVLAEYRPELAEGFFHAASGWVIFMIALAILLAFHKALAGAVALWGKRAG